MNNKERTAYNKAIEAAAVKIESYAVPSLRIVVMAIASEVRKLKKGTLNQKDKEAKLHGNSPTICVLDDLKD